ncbi:uncharacterized protein M6B38_257355 [Iris pallida]|uniref:Uncharacterized protein n=1 Tax=Iris pallida TaxID=29817 RepID=A0AAX6IGT7_IRIPA|nr:uncharacterized protein M6B38_257355 [Iris pallida]
MSETNLHLFSFSDYQPPAPLKTVPSFSIFNTIYHGPEEEDEAAGQFEEDRFDELGPAGVGRGTGVGFGFACGDQNASLVENSAGGSGGGGPLFLARGLGIDRIGSGLLNAGGEGGGGGGGGERSDVENYYRRMVEEDPGNALFLRNYAQFLYQSKGDSQRAEEYYSRAILAEPGDGEILSQYAKLVWELRKDKERASSYFEQAVRATPTNSHVHAAFASFLWETEDEDDVIGDEGDYFSATVHQGILTSAST